MTVYISECLETRHPDVALSMQLALKEAGVSVIKISGTGSIWARDFMPVKVGDHFVKFRPKADTVKWPFLEVPEKSWFNALCATIGMHDGKVIPSDIILDGGNVVRSPDGKRVIMCVQTLRDNKAKSERTHRQVTPQLESLLEAEIIWIPNEPFDDLGHSDGEVAWIDDRTVFVNDFRGMRDVAYHDYQQEVRRILRDRGIEAVPFPNAYDECREITEERFRKEHPQADEFNMAYGFFLNFLRVGDLVLYPEFGIDRDERCLDCLLDAWPDAKCVGIDCGYLMEEGGGIHCISAEF
jgi:agmatine/peptidylarginine deiminase